MHSNFYCSKIDEISMTVCLKTASLQGVGIINGCKVNRHVNTIIVTQQLYNSNE